MADFIGAVDQGTTSTRFIVFDHDGMPVASHQLEHDQILPRAGWVEHNPLEIWERTQTVIGSALTSAGLAPLIAALQGIESWTPAQKKSAITVLRAKGAEHERDFVRHLNAHPKLSAAIKALLATQR